MQRTGWWVPAMVYVALLTLGYQFIFDQVTAYWPQTWLGWGWTCCAGLLVYGWPFGRERDVRQDFIA